MGVGAREETWASPKWGPREQGSLLNLIFQMSAALSLPALSGERRRFLLFQFNSQAGQEGTGSCVEGGRVDKDGQPTSALAAAPAGPYSGS